MKKLLLFTLFSCIGFIAFAQRQNVYFLKNNGRPVNVKDSADIIRIVREPDSGSVLYNVLEYYKSGKLKLVGKSVTIEPVKLEEQVATFYENGNRKSISMYRKDILVGAQYMFYPDGKPSETRLYRDTVSSKTTNNITRDYLITSLYDTAGIAVITNGNGYYRVYNDKLIDIVEEGNVESGRKNGLWKGFDNKLDLQFEENYIDGQLIKGYSVTKQNDTVRYTKARAVQPYFKGGMDRFYQLLANDIRYPQNARERNIQGRVLVSFIVEKNGSLSNVEAFSNADKDLTSEAIRAVKLSKGWIAGCMYGRSVRVQYKVPVVFSLSR